MSPRREGQHLYVVGFFARWARLLGRQLTHKVTYNSYFYVCQALFYTCEYLWFTWDIHKGLCIKVFFGLGNIVWSPKGAPPGPCLGPHRVTPWVSSPSGYSVPMLSLRSPVYW